MLKKHTRRVEQSRCFNKEMVQTVCMAPAYVPQGKQRSIYSMATPLSCQLKIVSERDPIYWWPLIFEGMWRQSFRYTISGEPPGVGTYYYIRKNAAMDQDLVVAVPFRSAWDEIANETSSVLINFWCTDPTISAEQDPFSVHVSVDHNKGSHLLTLTLSMEDAEIPDFPMELVKRRIRRVFECARALYEMSKPCPSTGTMGWEDAETVASFGQPLDPRLDKNVRWGSTLPAVKAWPDAESGIEVLDPIPVRVRGGWKDISLFE